jgi:hypothetical protein
LAFDGRHIRRLRRCPTAGAVSCRERENPTRSDWSAQCCSRSSVPIGFQGLGFDPDRSRASGTVALVVCRCCSAAWMAARTSPVRCSGVKQTMQAGRNNQCIGCFSSWRSNYQDGVFSMTRARILALSLVAALALSSGALAQGGGGGGGGGGAGGAGSGAGGASGAAGTTGNSGGSIRGPSGNSVAQPSGGQSSPTGNTAAQPPGSTGQNSINSPGTGVGPGSTPGSTSTRP